METRAEQYARGLANWVNFTINALPVDSRENYKAKFLEELGRYSLEPKRRGKPKNGGCVYELSDLISVDIKNPEHLAKLIKESFHLLYQKKTSSRILCAFKKYIA